MAAAKLGVTDPPPLRWEVYVDSSPARLDIDADGGGTVTLHDGWTDALASPLYAALLDVAEHVDDVSCSRCRSGVGYGLTGAADEHVVWQATHVRLLTPSPTAPRIELLCEECATAEWEASAAAGMCVSCWRGMHQGCLTAYPRNLDPTGWPGQSTPMAWCGCACRRAFANKVRALDPPATDPLCPVIA